MTEFGYLSPEGYGPLPGGLRLGFNHLGHRAIRLALPGDSDHVQL